jgi:hypothetical protein
MSQYFYPHGLAVQDISVEKKGAPTGAHLDFEISFPGLAVGVFGVLGPGYALPQPSAPIATDAAERHLALGDAPAEAPTPEQQQLLLPSSAAAARHEVQGPGHAVIADSGVLAMTALGQPHFQSLGFQRQLAHIHSSTADIAEMPRGCDPKQNLTWLFVGYDIATRKYPKSQLFDNANGVRCFTARTRELAQKASTAIEDALASTALEPHARSLLEVIRDDSPPTFAPTGPLFIY